MIDAIDSLKSKTLLIARCRAAGLPVITCGGARCRRDPTQVCVTDLSSTHRDPLLRYVRKRLRAEHGFPREHGGPFGVPAVYSHEAPVYSWSDGTFHGRPQPGGGDGLEGDVGSGTAAFVTGAFGFAAAAWAVRTLAAERV